jgi:small conductance mechanosensitive channel
LAANLFFDALKNLWETFIGRLPALATGLLVVLIFYLIGRVARFLIHRSIRKVQSAEHAAQVISRFAFVGIVLLGVVVGLGVMGINAAALVASLGLVSVGIGFALKDVIENFIAGIILLLQRPFVVGDMVQIGGVEGSVEEVRVRDTVIRMLDGRQVFVPNAGIFRQAVINSNRNRLRRLEFEAAITYGEEAGKAMREASKVLGAVPGILDNPSPLVVVQCLDDGSVRLRAYFWIDPVQTGLPQVRSDAIVAVKRGFDEAGIRTPAEAGS